MKELIITKVITHFVFEVAGADRSLIAAAYLGSGPLPRPEPRRSTMGVVGDPSRCRSWEPKTREAEERPERWREEARDGQGGHQAAADQSIDPPHRP